MTLLQAYLRSPKARRALSKRPGDHGFSLIELVVVVAILAILAAVALPNFLGVSKDGQIAAAKNTLATILKECSVKEIRTGNAELGKASGTGTEQPIQAAMANLNGYTLVSLQAGQAAKDADLKNAIKIVAGAQNKDSCYSVAAMPTTALALPTFAVVFTPSSGATEKSCASPANTKYLEGCELNGVTAPAGTANGTW